MGFVSYGRPISADEFQARYQSHQSWLTSNGKSGRRADFSGMNLVGLQGPERANFSRAVFRGTHLEHSNLGTFGCLLGGADLRDAQLYMANLRSVYLGKADLRGANLTQANLSYADASRADFREAVLEGALLLKTKLDEADLSGAWVYGASVWDISTKGTNQAGLSLRPTTDLAGPKLTVDDIEIAQFVNLLIDRKKFRNAINAVTAKGVLILGRFSGGGIGVLEAIAEKMRGLGYLPIIFDFARPGERDYTETVKVLAGLARFVVVDLSGPSVPQELYATVPHYKIPFVPLARKGVKSYSMAVDLFAYPWFLGPVIRFSNIQALCEVIPEKVVEPAEAYIARRRIRLKEVLDE